MKILIGIMLVAALAFVAVWLIHTVAGVVSSRSGVRASALRAAKAERQIAVNALRKIARNDSGNPVLDATIALEDIESRESKELY